MNARVVREYQPWMIKIFIQPFFLFVQFHEYSFLENLTQTVMISTEKELLNFSAAI